MFCSDLDNSLLLNFILYVVNLLLENLNYDYNSKEAANLSKCLCKIIKINMLVSHIYLIGLNYAYFYGYGNVYYVVFTLYIK